ncbi:MAG: hypothetical protein JO316_23315 [Abitibacteriaceae bacterium]|nr:hypothetical protein [Abditibacteriaceae bacterium]
MSKITIPAPPQPTLKNAAGGSDQTKSQRLRPQPLVMASKPLAPLDAAFLSRTYGTMLWFGTLLALCAYTLTSSILITGSFAAGALLAALLLKSQELFVRRILRPKDSAPYQGWDARFPLAVLLPAKYILIGTAFALLISRHLLHPIGFTAGFMAVQTAIIAKIFGYMIVQRIRPIHEMNKVYGK